VSPEEHIILSILEPDVRMPKPRVRLDFFVYHATACRMGVLEHPARGLGLPPHEVYEAGGMRAGGPVINALVLAGHCRRMRFIRPEACGPAGRS